MWLMQRTNAVLGFLCPSLGWGRGGSGESRIFRPFWWQQMCSTRNLGRLTSLRACSPLARTCDILFTEATWQSQVMLSDHQFSSSHVFFPHISLFYPSPSVFTLILIYVSFTLLIIPFPSFCKFIHSMSNLQTLLRAYYMLHKVLGVVVTGVEPTSFSSVREDRSVNKELT